MRKILVTMTAMFTVANVFAANNFQSGSMDVAKAQQALQASKLKATSFNELFVCNNTHLSNQMGVIINVSFPQINQREIPAPGSCAWLSNDTGAFSTSIVISNQQGNTVHSQNLSSGQMLSVNYNPQNSSYVVNRVE